MQIWNSTPKLHKKWVAPKGYGGNFVCFNFIKRIGEGFAALRPPEQGMMVIII
jgi:hypothetical protein